MRACRLCAGHVISSVPLLRGLELSTFRKDELGRVIAVMTGAVVERVASLDTSVHIAVA